MVYLRVIKDRSDIEKFYSGFLMPTLHRITDPEGAHRAAVLAAKFGFLFPGKEIQEQKVGTRNPDQRRLIKNNMSLMLNNSFHLLTKPFMNAFAIFFFKINPAILSTALCLPTSSK